MNNNISIQTITWELQTSRLAQAKAWQEKVSSFSKYQLSSLLEEVFAPYNNDSRHITIGTIELNIGDIANESALKEQLQIALQKALGKQQDNQLAAIQYSLLEALEWYLINGTLPWYADKMLFADIDSLYPQLIAFSTARIKAAFKLYDNASAIRLTHLLGSEQRLIAFLHHLAGSANEEINAILAFIKVIISEGLAKNVPHRYQTIIMFKSLLQYFFVHSKFNSATFLKLWWADVVLHGYLSVSEQRLLTAFIAGETSVTSNVPSKTLTAQNRQWVNELNIIIQHTKPTQLVPPKQNETRVSENTIFYIENAGSVLLYIYLKKVFMETGLLNDKSSFISPESQMQAVKLLQFIICGHHNFKEYDLVLNKVLCGYDIEAPIIEADIIEQYDITKADELLLTAIKNWPKIGNTSPEGFRASFLSRKGKLIEETNNWILHIERKGIDILIDSLPYTISIIKLPWMQKPLYVQW